MTQGGYSGAQQRARRIKVAPWIVGPALEFPSPATSSLSVPDYLTRRQAKPIAALRAKKTVPS
jgi:hypothetical protein